MNVVVFLIAMGLFVFGLWVMSMAFGVPGFEAAVFFAGILCVMLAVAIPTAILGRADR